MLHYDTTFLNEIGDLIVDLIYWFIENLSMTLTRLFCVFCYSTFLSQLLL